MTKILVENIWAEDLFEWFYNHVNASGGDGAGAIVCSNYKETADYFIQWFIKKFNIQENGDYVYPCATFKINRVVHLGKNMFWHSKDEYENTINFHDNNENFIFTNKDIDLGHGDYTFVVVGDCRFAFEKPDSNKIIKAV